MATLAEFPNRRLLGEDVIWSGTPEEGMLSSHRIYSTATHSGDGIYGRATGKKLGYRIIADCHAMNNQINDEWLIRDQGAIVRQLGWTPSDYAADLIKSEGGVKNCVKPFTPEIDIAGPYKGRGNDNEWGVKYADILRHIMDANMAVIATEYDEACALELPGNLAAHGLAAADNFWMGLRASFPNAEFTIEHQIGRDDAMMPPRAAIRWGLYGKHEGWGSFGTPTGAQVYIMGASHAEFGPRGLRREFVLFDETAIWKQIHIHTRSV
jgi:predicted ester cyclase